MIQSILSELKDGFNQSIKALKREMTKVRTGRANPNLLDGIKVDYYGTPTPLQQISAIKVADARMITIQPWEKNMVAPIEKAILTADLGLNPSNDGTLIRLPIPPLTGERRKELTKSVRETGEKTKIAIRNQRRDANDMLKTLQKDGEISEDEAKRALSKVQDITDDFTKKVDTVVADKEKEIMEI